MHAAARRAVTAAGFEPDLDADAQRRPTSSARPRRCPPGVKDLRDLPWSSIDNDESRDLDQIEVAEQLPNGAIRLSSASPTSTRSCRKARRSTCTRRELHVGLHRRRHLPDAAGGAVDESHVAQRGRGPAGDRHRDGRRRRRRRRLVRRLPRHGAQQGAARLRRGRRVARRRTAAGEGRRQRRRHRAAQAAARRGAAAQGRAHPQRRARVRDDRGDAGREGRQDRRSRGRAPKPGARPH